MSVEFKTTATGEVLMRVDAGPGAGGTFHSLSEWQGNADELEEAVAALKAAKAPDFEAIARGVYQHIEKRKRDDSPPTIDPQAIYDRFNKRGSE
jgi:hypothetical protein